MISEKDYKILQLALQHYRTKCSQLEHDFLLYKIKTEQFIEGLAKQSNDERIADDEVNK